VENQQITAEEQERREAATKLLKILETSPFDEALMLTSAMLAHLLRNSRVEPFGEQWRQFFPAFILHVADMVRTLDSTPSPRIH
jgi:hypothetical protein